IAPPIRGHVATVDHEVAAHRAAVARVPRTDAAGCERRAQQSRGAPGGGFGRKLAAESVCGTQYREGEYVSNGRAIPACGDGHGRYSDTKGSGGVSGHQAIERMG